MFAIAWNTEHTWQIHLLTNMKLVKWMQKELRSYQTFSALTYFSEKLSPSMVGR